MSRETSPVVILCGGLATRLGPLASQLPKALIPIEGKPFVAYELELLRKQTFTNVVLCIGHLGSQIRRYAGDGSQWGVRVTYSDEGEQLLGTGGALKKAAPFLGDPFLVMYGDVYLPIDYQAILSSFEKQHKLGAMVIFKNYDRHEPSNVILEDNLITVYDKRNHLEGMIAIDAGVSVFRKEALSYIPKGEPYPLEDLFQRLVARKELGALETSQRPYEIGSRLGMEEFKQLISGKGVLA